MNNVTYCKRSHGVEGIPIDFSRDKSKDEVGNAACTISQVDDSNGNHALHSRTNVKRSKDRVPGRPKGEEPGEDLAHNRRLLVFNGVFERAKLFHRRAILYVSFLNTIRGLGRVLIELYRRQTHENREHSFGAVLPRDLG